MSVKFSDQLRNAILRSQHSRYEICKRIGLDKAVMSRFMAGKSGLSIVTIDALCDLLEIKLTITEKRKGTQR